MTISFGWTKFRLILAGVFSLGFALALTLATLTFDRVPHAIRPMRISGPIVSSIIRNYQGRQLVMIVLGSSTCGMSRGSELFSALQAVRDSLRLIAGRRVVAFASFGVALDVDPRIGVQWLDQLGEFDEVSSGGSWLNTAINEYVWRQPSGIGATPQVIVQLRSVDRVSVSRLRPPVGEVLIRMVGRNDIIGMAGLRDLDSLLSTRASHVPQRDPS